MTDAVFTKETDLCQQFIEALPDEWIAYTETGGFDILLVRKADGAQVGIEAKLRLNAKVILQAAESNSVFSATLPGPDFRAVLIPDNVSHELSALCRLLGIEVIKLTHKNSDWNRYSDKGKKANFSPDLPSLQYNHSQMCGEQWLDFCPHQRIRLPDFIPDTSAGNPSPIQLSQWKIKAIKIVIELQKKGFVTRADFKNYGISMSRWTQGGLTAWLQPGKERGQYVATDRAPTFKEQHPRNFQEILHAYEDWRIQ